MKKFITIMAMVMLVVVSATSQKLNWQGLKMVKSIEIESYLYDSGAAKSTIYAKATTLINFGYDSSTHLSDMDIKFAFENYKTKEKRTGQRETYTLRNGKLTRKDSDTGGDVDNSMYWKYYLDNGIITKIEEYSQDTNGGNGCLRMDHNITYTTDKNGHPIINRVVYEWYVRMRGTNYFQKGDGADSRTITKFRYLNGDLDYHSKSDTIRRRINWEDTPFNKYLSYNEVNNDTNINWCAMIFGYGLGGNCDNIKERFLTLTEWLPCRSKHLLTRCERWGKQDMCYTIKDDNIVSIDITKNGKLQRTIHIEYVE